MAERLNLVWLQSGGCGGCTISLLGAEGPDLLSAFAAGGIDLLWHPSLSAESGGEALAILDDLEAGRRPLTVGLGMPGLGVPAPVPATAGCAR